jgi:hypothetical protein
MAQARAGSHGASGHIENPGKTAIYVASMLWNQNY